MRRRFTIRRLMALVALSAVGLVVARPVVSRILWIWRTPGGVNLVTGRVEGLAVRRPGQAATKQGAHWLCEAGRPIVIDFDVDSEVLPPVPSGVPVVLTASAELFDWKSFNTPVRRAGRSFLLVAGAGRLDGAKGRVRVVLVPPHAGEFGLRYQTHVTDLLGRRSRTGLNTSGLTVR